jgi:hypothetical protein
LPGMAAAPIARMPTVARSGLKLQPLRRVLNILFMSQFSSLEICLSSKTALRELVQFSIEKATPYEMATPQVHDG